jgi:hypothetical protein
MHDAFVGGPSTVDSKEWRERVASLLAGADELDAYAEDVRKRGGLFRTAPRENLGCAIVLFAMASAAVWLIHSGALFWGLALALVVAVLVWAAVGSQTEPP